MSARSLVRLLLGVRALPPRVALFQGRAMLRAARLRDDFALVSSTRPRDVAELLRLARGRRNLVELGTATGWTAAALALAEPGRRVTSFDPVTREHRDAYLELLPRAARARLSLVQAPGAEAADGWDGEVDFLFVDSSHDRATTVEEVRAWRPRLAAGALVALHDYGNPAYPGVAEAVRELQLPGRAQAGCWVCAMPAPEPAPLPPTAGSSA
jgi:predicted O-methyltransferase YrrM